MFMDVLWRGSPAKCCDKEDALIQHFASRPGLRNVNRGGGGVSRANKSYASHVYAVFAPCGEGIGILQAARKRRRLSALPRLLDVVQGAGP